MSKRKSQTKTTNLAIEEQDEKRSIIYWMTILFTILFLFFAPFQKALFNGYAVEFERPIYSSILLGSLILFSISLYFFLTWRLRDRRDLLGILIWLIPLSFLISVIPAASHHQAINMVYIQCLYAIFFIIGLYMAKNRLGSTLIQWGIVGSGYVVVLYGVCVLLGNTFYPDAVMLNETGLRLTSVFQYANAYASYLVGLLLVSLFLLTRSNKWYFRFLHGSMAVIILLSFLLTLSRGGLVLLPVIFLLVFPMFSVVRQILIFIYLGIGSIVSLLVTGKINSIATDIVKIVQPTIKPHGTATVPGFTSQSLQGWLLLLGAALVCGVVFMLLQTYAAPYLERRLSRFSDRKYASLILPAALIILGVIVIVALLGDTGVRTLLPDSLQKRIESINFEQHSVLEREAFYRDSVKLFKDYPLFGAGGGAWATLYEKYQSNPYTSRQTHSFFLQYLLESGIVGLLLLLFLLGIVFYYFLSNFFKDKSDDRNRNLVLYILTVALLVHSSIDFEMSYVYLSALVFLCLGGMASRGTQTALPANRFSEFSKWRFVYPSFIGILSIALFAVTVISLSASSEFGTAVAEANNRRPLDEVLIPLNRALELQSANPGYLLTKISYLSQAYNQTKNEEYYEALKKITLFAKQKEPNDRLIIEAEYGLYIMKKQMVEALETMKRAISVSPWSIQYYERAIQLEVELGHQAVSSNNTQAGDTHWASAFELYQTVQEKTESLKSLPKGQWQGKPFSVTPAISTSIGQIYFMQGNFAEAAELLKQGFTGRSLDEASTRVAARWYLASLRKHGKDDPSLFSQLIAKDTNEQMELEKLLRVAILSK